MRRISVPFIAVLLFVSLDSIRAWQEPDEQTEIQTKPLSAELKGRLFENPIRPGAGESEIPKVNQRPDDRIIGEDVGAQGESSALLNAEIQMRRVSERLSEFDAGRQTQTIQAGILEQLNGVIKSRSQHGDPSVVGASSANSGIGGENLNTVATDDMNKTTTLIPMDVSSDRWEKLPPRIRDQLQSNLFDKFAPQYQRMLEKFYLRLATPATEDGENSP